MRKRKEFRSLHDQYRLSLLLQSSWQPFRILSFLANTTKPKQSLGFVWVLVFAVTFSPLHEPTSHARSAWWLESCSYARITTAPRTARFTRVQNQKTFLIFASLPRPLPALTNKGKVFWFWFVVTAPKISVSIPI